MQRGLYFALAFVLVPLCAFAAGKGRLGTSIDALTNTAQVLLQPVPVRTLTFCTIQGGAANQTVIFRGVGGSPTYATVNIPAGATVGRQLNAAIPAAGLEVVTQGAAGDVAVECTYRFGP